LFKLCKLIVDVPIALKFSVRDVGLAEMLKSCTLTATCVENEMVPDVPVTVRVTLPPGDTPVTCSAAVAVGLRLVRSTLEGVIVGLVHAQPDELKLRLTVPVKPAWLVTVMVDELDAPTWSTRDVGLEDKVNARPIVKLSWNDDENELLASILSADTVYFMKPCPLPGVFFPISFAK
jgi:hypothetical protein